MEDNKKDTSNANEKQNSTKHDSSNEKNKVGINLLRIGILLCCSVSLYNTATGLSQYVFKYHVWIACMLSFVFQSIIAVISLQYMQIIKFDYKKTEPKIDENDGRIKKIFEKLKFKVFNSFKFCWINKGVILIGTVAFGMSIFFDCIFVINSTYEVTKNDEKMAGVTAQFTQIKNDLLEYLTPYYNQSSNEVHDSIAILRTDTLPVGGTMYNQEWNIYWSSLSEVYNIEEPKTDIQELSTNLLNIKGGKSEYATMNLDDIEKCKNVRANYTVNAYVKKIIDAVSLIKPSYFTSAEVDEFIKLMEQTEEDLKLIITKEQKAMTKYNTIITSNIDFENVETSTGDAEGNDEIFADLIIFQKKIEKNEENKAEDAKKDIPEAEWKVYNPESDDENRKIFAEWEQHNWNKAIANQAAEVYLELSQKHIEACKKAISDIELFKVYLSGITSDARYNVALLISELSSSDIIDANEIDKITAKISQALFSGLSPDVSSAIDHFKDLKSKLTYYIPLKNIDYILRNLEMVSDNKANEEDEKTLFNKKSTKSQEVYTTPIPTASTKTNDDQNSENKNTVLKFDEEHTKEQIDLLIQYLSTLPENIEEYIIIPPNTQSDKATNDIGLYTKTSAEDRLTKPFKNESDDQIIKAIKYLIELEDTYLNEKNAMVIAYEQFKSKHSDLDKHNIMKSIEPSKIPVWFAVLFAILVDVFSLILGTIVQKWQKKE